MFSIVYLISTYLHTFCALSHFSCEFNDTLQQQLILHNSLNWFDQIIQNRVVGIDIMVNLDQGIKKRKF